MTQTISKTLIFMLSLGFTASVAAGIALADDRDRDRCYEITITNMTRGQVFTPVLVASHRYGVNFFTAGEPASEELAALAEEGLTDPLAKLLESMDRKVGYIAVTGDSDGDGLPLIFPGKSETVLIPLSRRYNRISLASMLAVTNDGFFALNSIPARNGVYTSPVYDAGSEENDERGAHIPGLGGEGYNPEDGEGFVHIHSGIHGTGDLLPENLDWRNPAAKITIGRSQCYSD